MKLAFFLFLLIYPMKSLNSEENDNRVEKSDVSTKCYEGLGCIETDSKWYDNTLRPVNLGPMPRHIIKADFLLLKPNKKASPDLQYSSLSAKYTNLKASGFDFKSEMMLLIHDFTSNGYTGWVKHTAQAVFTRHMAINVVSIDWQRGAEPPYDQAIANARVVALEIIQFLKELKEKFHFSLQGVHIVGHGVGAHIAGYVGNAHNNLKKITGLDPSGPRFEGMPDIVKLHPSCANYVEIIHTDAYNCNIQTYPINFESTARSQGTRELMGHSDFFVRNSDKQLGCGESASPTKLVSVGKTTLNQGDILPGCSHKRAFKYFIQSLGDANCTFLGLKCDSYENFFQGKCTSCGEEANDCRTFGTKTYKSSAEKVSYFLSVAEKPPFCMFLYKVIIKLSPTEKEYYGYFDFILIDGDAKASEATLGAETNFRNINNGNNTFVYYAHPPKLSAIKEVKVRWNQKKKFYCFIYCKQSIDVDQITFEKLECAHKKKRMEEIVCPSDGNTEIENGSYKKFRPCQTLKEEAANLSTTTTTTAKSTTPTNKTKTTIKTTKTNAAKETTARSTTENNSTSAEKQGK